MLKKKITLFYYFRLQFLFEIITFYEKHMIYIIFHLSLIFYSIHLESIYKLIKAPVCSEAFRIIFR